MRPASKAQDRGQALVTLLAVVVAVDYADRNALGAVAPELKSDLGISSAQFGLIGGAFGLVGGLATLVAGALVDRVPRLRMLAVSALAWSVAMLATGVAQSFVWLLLARAALAVVLATVGPAYPSIISDVVPPERRTVALGRIATGQLVGGAVGIAVGAVCVAVLTWRDAFFVLTIPAVLLVVRLWRTPEPVRRGDPSVAQVPWGTVLRTVARTPTLVLVLLSASVGAYYLAGAASFAVLFAVAHYDVPTVVADLTLLALLAGAVTGIVLGSRLSDRLTAEDRRTERLHRAGQAYVLTAVAWLPALLVGNVLLALPFLVLGSAALAATIPVLDAVRIEVVPPGILGRAEALRTLLRALFEGAAPVIFGQISGAVGNDDQGLQLSFLVALPSLVAAAWLLRRATRTFDVDHARVLAQG